MSTTQPKVSRRRPQTNQGVSDETLRRSLTEQERARLSIDAWEPSLLRHLLRAQDKLNRKPEA